VQLDVIEQIFSLAAKSFLKTSKRRRLARGGKAVAHRSRGKVAASMIQTVLLALCALFVAYGFAVAAFLAIVFSLALLVLASIQVIRRVLQGLAIFGLIVCVWFLVAYSLGKGYESVPGTATTSANPAMAG
jgi:hypothetical protein